MVRSETGLSDNFLNLKDILHLTSQRETAQEHTLLEVKSTVARTYIEVDSADGVIPLNLSQIRKLPPLVDTQKVHPCLWGLALLDDKVAFIVDLDVLTSG